MEFLIESPSYFRQHYEVDKEIVDMSVNIREYMIEKRYSDIITRVHIFPVVAPVEIHDQGLWKEWVKISKTINIATVFKHINYDNYMHGTIDTRKKLTIKCVLDSIWEIKKKPGTKFNAKQFEQDLLEFVGYTKEELYEEI